MPSLSLSLSFFVALALSRFLSVSLSLCFSPCLSLSLPLSLSLSLSPSLCFLSLFFLRFAVVHTKKSCLHAAACGHSVHHRMENCRDHQTNLNIIQNIQMASRFLQKKLKLYTSRKSVFLQKIAALPHHSMCARVLLHLHLVRSIIYLFELEAVSLRSPSGWLQQRQITAQQCPQALAYRLVPRVYASK